MGELAADREFFAAAVEGQVDASGIVALGTCDAFGIDDAAAVDLPEFLWIKARKKPRYQKTTVPGLAFCLSTVCFSMSAWAKFLKGG